MSVISTILENEDFQNHLEENKDIIFEAEEMVTNFNKVLKSFIIANPVEFIAENIDQTRKNIKVFTEIATCQYMSEVASMLSSHLSNSEVTQETSNEDPYF